MNRPLHLCTHGCVISVKKYHQQKVRFLWLLVVLAVVAHPDIHMVLAVCGFANVADHMSIIGFQLIVDFAWHIGR
jgi:hypothetical protein